MKRLVLFLASACWLGGAAVRCEDQPPVKDPANQPAAKKPVKKKGGVSTAPGPNDVLVELEDFTLTDIEVVEAADAGQGKCVKFLKESSKCEKAVPLTKGKYAVEVYMKVQDKDHDTLCLSVLNKEKIKVFPSHAKLPGTEFVRVPVDEAPKTPLVLEVEKDGAITVTFLAKETGMLVDRVIFRKQEETAKP